MYTGLKGHKNSQIYQTYCLIKYSVCFLISMFISCGFEPTLDMIK